MVDLHVENETITSIDGYEVGGGELTGEALMNATKDSTTITRTLDTDGKVKFDSSGIIKKITKSIYVNLEPKEYAIGDTTDGVDINTGLGEPISALPPAIQFAKGIKFMGVAYKSASNQVSFRYICIKGGTLSAADHLIDTVECWYI